MQRPLSEIEKERLQRLTVSRNAAPTLPPLPFQPRPQESQPAFAGNGFGKTTKTTHRERHISATAKRKTKRRRKKEKSKKSDVLFSIAFNAPSKLRPCFSHRIRRLSRHPHHDDGRVLKAKLRQMRYNKRRDCFIPAMTREIHEICNEFCERTREKNSGHLPVYPVRFRHRVCVVLHILPRGADRNRADSKP